MKEGRKKKKLLLRKKKSNFCFDQTNEWSWRIKKKTMRIDKKTINLKERHIEYINKKVMAFA